jgi:predicted nicotinamide N-methyase
MTTDSSVFITDGDTDALALLRQNIERNRPPPNNEGQFKSQISCNQLIWGKESSTAFLEHSSEGKRFDVLIASDIVYAECIIEPLWQTVETLLSRKGGVFIMAFARRKVPVSKEHVLESAEMAGFQHELVREDTDEGIWIYTFRYKDKEDSNLCSH